MNLKISRLNSKYINSVNIIIQNIINQNIDNNINENITESNSYNYTNNITDNIINNIINNSNNHTNKNDSKKNNNNNITENNETMKITDIPRNYSLNKIDQGIIYKEFKFDSLTDSFNKAKDFLDKSSRGLILN